MNEAIKMKKEKVLHVFFGNDFWIVRSMCHGCAMKGSANK